MAETLARRRIDGLRRAMNPAGGKPLVWHLSRSPDHAHIHRLKVECLRRAGLDARAVLVPGNVPLLRRPGTPEAAPLPPGWRILAGRLGRLRALLLVARHALMRDTVVHILRMDPRPFYRLRTAARRFGRDLTCVLELEGDLASERDYLLHRDPAGADRITEPMIRANRRDVAQADGLVLMSRAHIELWQQRLGRTLRAVAAPALFDPEVFHFSSTGRQRIRSEWSLGDRLTFIYTGNVVCAWQCFPQICRLLRDIHEAGIDFHFVCLTRPADLALANREVAQAKLSAAATVSSVPPDELPGYLSAADIGLFIREDHPMNRIVCSAKLGEYLACGLPVLTTGVNALFNPFIRDHDAGVWVPDTAEWASSLCDPLLDLAAKGRDPAWRRDVSGDAAARFGGDAGPLADYVRFVQLLCLSP